MTIHTLFSDPKTGTDMCLEQQDEKSWLMDLTLYRNREDYSFQKLTPVEIIGIALKMIKVASKHLDEAALKKAYETQVPSQNQRTMIRRIMMALIGKS
jgi:hypothetical protein